MATPCERSAEVVELYRAAADASIRTPARRGNLIVLESQLADEVMVTADLHGHQPNFDAICRIADLESHPRRHLVIQELCHGGPATESGVGCRSFELVERVARLKLQFPEQVHFLLGNHELAELTEFPIMKAGRILNLTFRMGLAECYGQNVEGVRQAFLQFIRSCPLAVKLPEAGVFISHSLPDGLDKPEGRSAFDPTIFQRPLVDADLEACGSVFRLVWGRDYRPENAEAFCRLVGCQVLIHGHEPCREGFKAPNDRQVILDCCSSHGRFVMLKVHQPLAHHQIVSHIERLTAEPSA